MAPVDGECNRKRQQRDGAESMAASQGKDGSAARIHASPTRHRRMEPSRVDDHRARQLEDGAPKVELERAEPEHAAQDVGAGPGDDELGEHDGGEGRRSPGTGSRSSSGTAEDARLPIEGERRAEHVVRVPQWEHATVDLMPRQVGPRARTAGSGRPGWRCARSTPGSVRQTRIA